MCATWADGAAVVLADCRPLVARRREMITPRVATVGVTVGRTGTICQVSLPKVRE